MINSPTLPFKAPKNGIVVFGSSFWAGYSWIMVNGYVINEMDHADRDGIGREDFILVSKNDIVTISGRGSYNFSLKYFIPFK